MAAVEQQVPELVIGDKLTRDEFLRRWEVMPDVKRAELIAGVVYMPSPLSLPHGVMDPRVATWLSVYAASTPGCEVGSNTTWLMGEDSPQPDSFLRVLPEYGGQSRTQGHYPAGAPELVAEVCVSSTAYDLHQKLELYQDAGVREYLAVLMRERQVRWHRLRDGRFQIVPAAEDGVYRSSAFPGLWLDAEALLAGETARLLAVLQQGVGTPEHAAFVAELAARRRPS